MLPGMQKFLKNYRGKYKKGRNDISCNHVKQNKQSHLGHELICEKGLVWTELPALTASSKRAQGQKIYCGGWSQPMPALSCQQKHPGLCLELQWKSQTFTVHSLHSKMVNFVSTTFLFVLYIRFPSEIWKETEELERFFLKFEGFEDLLWGALMSTLMERLSLMKIKKCL